MVITTEVITNENRLLKEAVLYLWLEHNYDTINGLSIQDSKLTYPFGHGQCDNVTFLTHIPRSSHRDYIVMKRASNLSFYHYLNFHFWK